MDDFASPSLSNSLVTSEAVIRINMDEATWWKKHSSSPNTQPLNSPMSPLSFSFLNPDQRNAFNFSTPTSTDISNIKEKTVVIVAPKRPELHILIQKAETTNKSTSETYSPTSSCSSSSSTTKKTLQVKDLLIVDDDDPSSSTTDGYEPKAHLGWASFGKSIKKSPAKNIRASPQGRRSELSSQKNSFYDNFRSVCYASTKTRENEAVWDN